MFGINHGEELGLSRLLVESFPHKMSYTTASGAFSLHRDLPVGGVYDCTSYGAWGQTSWFLLANSVFPPHKTSKTAGSGLSSLSRAIGQTLPITGFWGQISPTTTFPLRFQDCHSSLYGTDGKGNYCLVTGLSPDECLAISTSLSLYY